MIDRSRLLFCFRRETLLWAAGISLSLFAALPAGAFLCLLAGWLAFLGCWLAILLMVVVSLGGLLVGVVGTVVGLSLLRDNNEKGWSVIVGSAGLFIVGAFCRWLFAGWYALVAAAAFTAVAACDVAASRLYFGVFVHYHVYLWSWLVLGTALLAAGLVLLAIGLLRWEAAVKYSFLKIGYACSVCHWRGVPVFRCGNRACGALLEDLRPTPYGVWQARCGSCGAWQPTTDLGGRLRLEKLCRRCSHDLNDASLGRRGEFHIAVVGATSSGKTNLMVAALWRLREAFAGPNGLQVRFADPVEEADYQRHVGLLREGKVMPKTPTAPTPRAFNVVLQAPDSSGCLLYMYDAAGEDFEAGESNLARHTFHHYVDGILFVIDPFAEPGLRDLLSQEQAKKVNPAGTGAAEILGRLISFWEHALRVSGRGRFSVPVAVVVTKMDACGPEDRPGLAQDVGGRYSTMAAAAQQAERSSPRVYRFLAAAGLANLLGILEARFERVCYFGASALGRLPDPTDESPFEPRGVLAPLVWLGHETGALSDAPGVARAMRNFGQFFRRAMRGQEGTSSEVAAWGVTLAGLGALLHLLWHLGGAALALGAIAVGALLILQARRATARGANNLAWLPRRRSPSREPGPVATSAPEVNRSVLDGTILAAVLGVGVLWFLWWPLGCLAGSIVLPLIVCACFAADL
jgi:hypothetical protein